MQLEAFASYIERIESSHTQRYANDPVYRALYDDLEALADQALIPVNGDEHIRINQATANVEAILANYILYHMGRRVPFNPTYGRGIGGQSYNILGPDGPEPYTFYSNLYFNFHLIGFYLLTQRTVDYCDGATSIPGALRNLWRPMPNVAGCWLSSTAANEAFNTFYSPIWNNRDAIILNSSDYALHLNLLQLIGQADIRDPDPTSILSEGFQLEFLYFLTRVKELYGENNIVAKAYTGVGLVDLPDDRFGDSFMRDFASVLERKVSPDGAYAEGTDYLEYVNQQALPMYYLSKVSGWLNDGNRMRKYEKTGDWLLKISDASGAIPRVDDAANSNADASRSYWLAPYAEILQDERFMEYTRSPNYRLPRYAAPAAPNGFAPTGVVKRFLTYPIRTSPATVNPVFRPQVDFTGGVGKVRYFDHLDASIDVALLAENGPTHVDGGGHDQQDNGSITLSRQATAGGAIDRLILDPGYAGATARAGTSAFTAHNSVLINGGGVSPNVAWTEAELKEETRRILDIENQSTLDMLWDRFGSNFFRNSNNNLDRDAGGGPAELHRTYANGLGIRQFYDIESTPGVKDFNNRTVLHLGEDILIIDNIHSNQDNYSLQYNLPRTTSTPGANSIDLVAGGSQVRLSIFSQNSPTLGIDHGIAYQDRDGNNLAVSRLRATDNGTGAPFSHPFFSFLTVVEPRDQAVVLGTAYATVAGATAAICVSRTLGDVITYVFVNLLSDGGTRNTVTIPALTGWNAAFTTDADFGIFEFNRATGTIGGRVYRATTAAYAGSNVAIRNSTDFGSSPLIADTHLVPITQTIPHSIVRGNVTVPAFTMDAHEVSQGDYFAVREHRPSFFSGNDQLPVERITLYDAILYCNRRSQMEGFQQVYSHGTPAFNESGNCTYLPDLIINFGRNGYRLPTPDEWNAASGLNRDQPPVSTAFDAAHGRFKANSAEKTHPVGELLSVANSLFDITGNVAEWTFEGVAQGDVQAQGLSYEDTPSALPKSAKHIPANQVFPSVGFRAVRRNAIVVPADQPNLQAALAAAVDNQTIFIDPGTPPLTADIVNDRNVALVFSADPPAQFDLGGHSITLSSGSISVSDDPNIRSGYFSHGGVFVQAQGGRTRAIYPSIETAVNGVASDETIIVTKASYTIASRAELGMVCDVNGNNCSPGAGPQNVLLRIDPHSSISLVPSGINGIYVNNTGKIDFGVGVVLNPYVVLIDGERTVEAGHDRIGFFPNIKRSLEISQPRQTTQLGGQTYPLADFVAVDEAVIGDLNPDILKRTIINFGNPLAIPGDLPLVFHNDVGVLFKNLEFHINLPDLDVNQGIFRIASSGTMNSRMENCIFVNVNTSQPRRGRMFLAEYGAGKLEVWHCLFKNFHVGIDFNITSSGAGFAPDIKANIFDGNATGLRFSERAHASKVKCNNFFESGSGAINIGATALRTEVEINQNTLGGNLVRSPFFIDEGMLDFRLIRQIKPDFLETLRNSRWYVTGLGRSSQPTTIANPLLGACDGEDIGPILEVFKVIADNPFSKIRFKHPLVDFTCDFRNYLGPVIIDLPQLGTKGICHEISIPPRPKPIPVIEIPNFPYNRGSGPFLPITLQFTNRPVPTPYQPSTNVFRFVGNGWLNARATQSEFGPLLETTVSKTIIPDFVPPTKPRNFIAQRTSGGVLMTWNAAIDVGNGGGVPSGGARYQIIRETGSPVLIASVEFSRTSFTDPDIIPGAKYHIVAYDSMGNHGDDATTPIIAPWEPGLAYQVGERAIHNGIVYEVRQDHTSQIGLEPPVSTALWHLPTPDGTAEWAPNTHYIVGSQVTFQAETYNCLQEHTSRAGWEPPNNPAIWQFVFPLIIQMKDNGLPEANISKPQFYVRNASSSLTLRNFTMRLWLSRQEMPSQEILADSYYFNPSGILVSVGYSQANPNLAFVDIKYPSGFSLAPGESMATDGAQLGLHFRNYYPGQWDRTNDWSWLGITDTFSGTGRVTVYDETGNLLYGEEPSITSQPLPPDASVSDLFGFEKLFTWGSEQAALSLSTNRTQGAASLQVEGGGYSVITALPSRTQDITGETSRLALDIYIPGSQPNPYWVGAAQMYVDCFSAGIHNTYLGNVELTGLAQNQFSTLRFDLPASVLAALQGSKSDFVFKIVLNINSGTQPFLLDNLRFVP